MYAETGIFFPYIQNFSLENQQLEEYRKSQKPYDPMSNLGQTSSIAEYDLGGESDLFKAPEPIIEEETIIAVDPMMTAAMTMISRGENVITFQGLDITNMESIQREQPLLDEVFYECEKDLLVKSAMESPLSKVLDIKNVPALPNTDEENLIQKNIVFADAPLQKSESSSNLTSMEWMTTSAVTPKLMEFPMMDFGVAYGMRRAFSEGDIQTLGTRNTGIAQFPLDRIIGSCTSEDRRDKLSRYRIKKSRRNFDRKIKYACRKALADSQPRIRGRFAKTEESSDVSKRQ